MRSLLDLFRRSSKPSVDHEHENAVNRILAKATQRYTPEFAAWIRKMSTGTLEMMDAYPRPLALTRMIELDESSIRSCLLIDSLPRTTQYALTTTSWAWNVLRRNHIDLPDDITVLTPEDVSRVAAGCVFLSKFIFAYQSGQSKGTFGDPNSDLTAFVMERPDEVEAMIQYVHERCKSYLPKVEVKGLADYLDNPAGVMREGVL